MSPIGSVNSLQPSLLARIDAPQQKTAITLSPGSGAPAPAGGSFGSLLDGLVATVDAKQSSAQAITNRVLLGQSDQLHQSVIAMQEASVAFSLMVEVRNKLVDSYQELMRMQA